jgi:hypothetical protein
MVVRVWNLLGGLEWQALDVAVELFGVTDVEALIRGLAIIRDHSLHRDD